MKDIKPGQSLRENPSITRREFLNAATLFGAAALMASCTPEAEDFAGRETGALKRLIILYTNDEHGWLEPWKGADGAAGMAWLWRTQEGYESDKHFLVLSGGDMWTGPVLSTWYEGESMIDVMNAMGYQAAAIGNHDFDYGLDSLSARAAQAKFPFLSANIRRKDTGAVPDFAKPFTIRKVNGINVAMIGLTTIETPVDTKPEHIADLDFVRYDRALREFVPRVQSQGADLVLVLGHICTSEMERLAPIASELGIPVIFGGHCHEETNSVVSGVTIVQSGSFLRNYIRIALLVDTDTKQVVEIDSSLHRNSTRGVEESIERRITDWRQRSDPSLWEVIGYAGEKIDSRSLEMAFLLTESWLSAYPQGQLAIASPRYVQSISAGDITPGTVISTLPMENQLVDVVLTGKELLEIIEAHQPILGGFSEFENYRLRDGSPLQPDHSYHVLMPDSLYNGGNYYQVKKYQSQVEHTGIDWRAPIVDWITSLHTTRGDPLEAHLAR